MCRQTAGDTQPAARHVHIFQRMSGIWSMAARPACSFRNEKLLVLPHDNQNVEFDVRGTHKETLQKAPIRLAEKPGRFGSAHD